MPPIKAPMEEFFLNGFRCRSSGLRRESRALIELSQFKQGGIEALRALTEMLGATKCGLNSGRAQGIAAAPGRSRQSATGTGSGLNRRAQLLSQDSVR